MTPITNEVKSELLQYVTALLVLNPTKCVAFSVTVQDDEIPGSAPPPPPFWIPF